MNEDQKTRLKDLMLEHQLTVSTAESLTAGLVQADIASISGASGFFEGGVTAYSLERKVDLLGVDKEHALEVNSVSQRVVEEMAKGVTQLFKTEIGLSTTGYAEPYVDEQRQIPYPMAHIAIFIKGSIVFHEIIEGPDLSRDEMRNYVTTILLEQLVEQLKIL